jgi:hypothetical protein
MLGKLVRDALWRRINAGAITRKHLQHGLGISESTVDNLLSGHHEPSSRVLTGLIAMLDAAFANEVLAHTGVVVFKLSDARAAAIRRANEALNELARVGLIR